MVSQVVVLPATPDRWPDLERLFGENGVYGCWCMFHRLTGAEFGAGARAGGECNRLALKDLVEKGHTPGLIGYSAGAPVGWVALAPRTEYGRVERSRFAHMAPAEPALWSIVCFFVHRSHRGRGVAGALLQAAVEYAAAHRARIVEAYPVDTSVRAVSQASA